MACRLMFDVAPTAVNKRLHPSREPWAIYDMDLVRCAGMQEVHVGTGPNMNTTTKAGTSSRRWTRAVHHKTEQASYGSGPAMENDGRHFVTPGLGTP
jgi:hypothetical protein